MSMKLLDHEFEKLGDPAMGRIGVNGFCIALNGFLPPEQEGHWDDAMEELHRTFQGKFRKFSHTLFREQRAMLRTNKFGFVQVQADALPREQLPEGVGPLDLPAYRKMNPADIRLPDRWRYAHCQTSVRAPSNFHYGMVRRSGQLPSKRLELEHVYGYNSRCFGKNVFWAPSEEKGVSREVLCCTAGTGVVFDHEDNRQRFFHQHTAEITCVTVDPSRRFVATGQAGKTPIVLVWELSGDFTKRAEVGWVQKQAKPYRPATLECRTHLFATSRADVHPPRPEPVSAQAGAGGMDGGFDDPSESARLDHADVRHGDDACFYSRAISALAFSANGRWLLAVGADDRHRLGLWDWVQPNGRAKLIAEGSARNGRHPQVFGAVWTPPEVGGHSPVDFVTFGNQNIVFWAYTTEAMEGNVAAAAGGASGGVAASAKGVSLGAVNDQMGRLVRRNGKYGSFTPPSRVNCVAFSRGGNAVSCGDNGWIYLWDSGSTCLFSFPAHDGEATALCFSHAHQCLVSGGDEGRLLFWRLTRGGEVAVDKRLLHAKKMREVDVLVSRRYEDAMIEDAHRQQRQRRRRRKQNGGGGGGGSGSGSGSGGQGGGGGGGGGGAASASTVSERDEEGDGRESSSRGQRGHSRGSSRSRIGGTGMGGRKLESGRRLGGRKARSNNERIINNNSADDTSSHRHVRNRSTEEGGGSNNTGSGSGGGSGESGKKVKGWGDSTVLRPHSIRSIDAAADGSLVVGTNRSCIFVIPPDAGDLGDDNEPKLCMCGHFGEVHGLGVVQTSVQRAFITGGHDQTVIMWDADTRRHIRSTHVTGMPLAIAMCDMGSLVAVGCEDGTIHFLRAADLSSVLVRSTGAGASHRGGSGDGNFGSGGYDRGDGGPPVTDLKFSPDGRLLAVGTGHGGHYIDIHGKHDGWRRVHRCRGHSRPVKHLDWSADSTTLMSNCEGGEVMYWDAARDGSGKPLWSSSASALTSKKNKATAKKAAARGGVRGGKNGHTAMAVEEVGDADWASWTCTFGFPVMGVVPDESEREDHGHGGAGTGVNGCDMSPSLRCVVTAESSGFVKLFNAPCLVKNAPHRAYVGHGGLGGGVAKVRFVGAPFKRGDAGEPTDDGPQEYDEDEGEEAFVVSIGGSDGAVLQWRLRDAEKGEPVLEDIDVQ
eukprot:g1239.t1